MPAPPRMLHGAVLGCNCRDGLLSGKKANKHTRFMSAVPRIAKWPFLLGDLLLVGLAGWIVSQYPPPLAPLPLVCVLVCVALGAWFGVTPFLSQYQAATKVAESDALTAAVEQINNVRNLANQISFATAQWQVVQEHAGRTVDEARKIGDKISEEARSFGEFMAKANDREKAHLRLEAEKFRRGQEEWLQVIVGLLDHVFALYRAAANSGQPNLIHQLGQFQMACREMVRRVGLVALEAAPDEVFNPEEHQLADPSVSVPADARIVQTLATGYTFQGKRLRRVVVMVDAPPPPAENRLAEPAPADAVLE